MWAPAKMLWTIEGLVTQDTDEDDEAEEVEDDDALDIPPILLACVVLAFTVF